MSRWKLPCRSITAAVTIGVFELSEHHNKPGSSRTPSSQLHAIVSSVPSFLQRKWINSFSVHASTLPISEDSAGTGGRKDKCSPDTLEALLALCEQKEPITWEEAFTEKQLEEVYKLSEGAFGEVFCTLSKDGSRYNVFKIVPICGTDEVNGYNQITASEALPELISSQLLSRLQTTPHNMTNCFIELQSAKLVKGGYQEKFLDAWRVQEENTTNEDPEQFADDQLFLIFEYEYGGNSMDEIKLTDPYQSLSLFCQCSLALAAAEQEYEFEHRDLHIGNILVFSKPKEKTHRARVFDRDFSFPDRAISVRLIDFTLSRFKFHDRVFFYNLLDDPYIFKGDGSELHHQVYKDMRGYTEDKWKQFHPVTNALWLEYLLEILLEDNIYETIDEDCMFVLSYMKKKVEESGSATEVVFSKEFEEVKRMLDNP